MARCPTTRPLVSNAPRDHPGTASALAAGQSASDALEPIVYIAYALDERAMPAIGEQASDRSIHPGDHSWD